jgi:phosphate transport system substrate-binding protein
MTDAQEQAATAAGGQILHIPMTLGPEAVVINLPGIKSNQLKLTPDVLADIYLKKITKWNDDRLKAINSGISLPNADITVVHRSDGSGTTFIFTNYLSKVSPEWQSRVGFGTSVNWPGDVGGQGNEGVTGQVKQLIGSIGYVELAYATQTNLPFVQVKNKAGNFVSPTLENASNAAAGITLPDDMKVLITDSGNPQAYPITGFTWVLAYVNAADAGKGKTLASYLWWAIHDGQKLSSGIGYAALPSDAVKKAEAEILKLMCGAAPCLTKS